jgi:hypothetical protein
MYKEKFSNFRELVLKSKIFRPGSTIELNPLFALPKNQL